MTRLLCSALALGLAGFAAAEDSPYIRDLMRLQTRQATLEVQHADVAKGGPKLTPAEEKERLQIAGQLAEMDPIGVLLSQLEQDIRTLLEQKTASPTDAKLIDQLKDFMALTAGMQSQAKSQEDARKIASQLRRFIVRRDVDGMKKYVVSFR